MLGSDRTVESICSGGFELDVEFSATRLRELAKMDGAIVLNREGTRILRAATQLVPDPRIETVESGTRHRTAERVAKQTHMPVISVSQSMSIVALYVSSMRHVLEARTQILAQANQALQTLERYRSRLDEVTSSLSALEIEDLVTIREVSAVLQRLEMVRRISGEIEQYVVELGVDGRLVGLQLEELTGGIGRDRELVIRDYAAAADASRDPAEVLESLATLDGASCSTCPRSPAAWASRSSATAWTTTASPPPVTGSCTAYPACPARSSTASSSTSATSRPCCPPASRASWRSTASARHGPGPCARACPGWPSPRSSSATPSAHRPSLDRETSRTPPGDRRWGAGRFITSPAGPVGRAWPGVGDRARRSIRRRPGARR